MEVEVAAHQYGFLFNALGAPLKGLKEESHLLAVTVSGGEALLAVSTC